jgi:3-phosphoshikimate 1-carboxyvinyltransferase
MIGGELVPRAVDEIPIACALAARAAGTTTIRDAEELRVKESDRIATMAGVLRAFGVVCEELPDGLSIEGKEGPLEPATVDSKGDHRIAMTAAILALLGRGPSRITDADCIATSFPRFVGTLRALGARVDVEEDA